MADLNPLTAWRRLLALPNESRAKTLAVAFLVSTACALLVSAATVILRPIQAANRAAEEQAQLAALVAGIPGMAELLTDAGGTLSTVVIDLESGRAAEGVTPQTLAAALEDAANWSDLGAEADLAGLGRRPDLAQVYLLRDGTGAISLALLPIAGMGYVGPIDAIIALHGDMNTVAGLTVTGQSETPGLGARIAEAAWQANFRGVRVADEAGRLRIAVARGTAGNAYEVDGITGATRTSSAMSRMLRFWLGPDGYGPFLDAVRRGEF